MLGMTMTRLPHIHLLADHQECKGNGKTVLVSYTLTHASKNGKVTTTAIGNTRLNRVGYVLDILD